MTDETSPEEWYAWMLREKFRVELTESRCACKATRLINAMRSVELTYMRGFDLDNAVAGTTEKQ